MACSYRFREVLYDDGQWWQQRHNTTVVWQSLWYDSEATKFRTLVQSRGLIHGDLQWKSSRSFRSEAKQAIAQSQRAQCLGAVRGRAKSTSGYFFPGDCFSFFLLSVIYISMDHFSEFKPFIDETFNFNAIEF